MSRYFLAMAVLGSMILALGCRMCANPYQECGPLYGGQCGESCNSLGRVGSVIAPAPMPAATGVPPGVPMGGPNMEVPGYVISETDRAVPADGTVVEGKPGSPTVGVPAEWMARPLEKTPTR